MRFYALIFILALAGCATPYVPPATGGTTLDYIQQDGGRLGWSGIYIGDTLQAVEKNTGQTLTATPDAFPTCGNQSAELKLHDRKVTLQLDSSSGATVVQSISVDLPENERGLQTPGASETLKSRFPKLAVIWSDGNNVELGMPDHQAILIKNEKEHFVDLTHAACID